MTSTSSELHVLTTIARSHVDSFLLLLFTFDGVLTGYRSDPARVRLPRRMRELLRRCIALPRTIVGVVSGRRLVDLRMRANLGDEAFYIGLHGLEAAGPGFTRVEADTFGPCRERLLDVLGRLEPSLAGVHGVRLEFKNIVLALHTAEAASRDAVWSRFRLLDAAADVIRAGVVRVIRGHDVLELVPNVEYSRAGAVVAIRRDLERRQHEAPFVMYVGEDAADDDTFDVVSRDGVAAVVGRRQPRAAAHLASPLEVEQFIRTLLDVRLAAQSRVGARDAHSTVVHQ